MISGCSANAAKAHFIKKSFVKVAIARSSTGESKQRNKLKKFNSWLRDLQIGEYTLN